MLDAPLVNELLDVYAGMYREMQTLDVFHPTDPKLGAHATTNC